MVSLFQQSCQCSQLILLYLFIFKFTFLKKVIVSGHVSHVLAKLSGIIHSSVLFLLVSMPFSM